MRSKERIQLTGGQWFNHFVVSINLLIAAGIFGYPFIKFYLLKWPNPNPNDFNFFYLMALFIGLSIFLYWQNWKSLFFQEYKATMTDKQFKRAIKVTAKELNWQISTLEKNYAEAIRSQETFGNGGEKITIKKTAHKVLINSIGDPELLRKGYSRKRNKENLQSFLINAANIIKGKDAEGIVATKLKKEQEAFWEESEWTIKNSLMRVLGYGFVLIFLLAGVLLVYEGIFEGIIPIGLSLAISWVYIKNDIQIIREKNRRKKKARSN